MRFQVFKSIVQHRTHAHVHNTLSCCGVPGKDRFHFYPTHLPNESVCLYVPNMRVFLMAFVSRHSPVLPPLHCATTLTAGLHWIAAISHDTNAACNSFTGHGNLNRRSVSPTHSRYQEQPDTFPCPVSRKPFTHSRTLLSSTSRHHFTNDTC